MTGSHLNDGNLVLFRQAEECLGYADIVVEVPLCIEHIIFLWENSGNQLFRSRLTVGAGDADYWDVELATVLTGKILESLQTVVDKDKLSTMVARLLLFGDSRVIDNRIGTSFF